jgi:drug/metabolite transporter (DMT)-like permease
MATAVAVPVPRARATAPAVAYAGLALASICWAAGFIAGKVALGGMTPLAVAAWRYVVAAIILLPFAVAQRPRRSLGGAARPLALMLLCGGVLYPWLFLAALARTTATTTSLLIALNPVLTLCLASLVGERVDRGRAGGIVVALAGAAIVITGGDLAGAGADGAGAGGILALLAAATWATFNIAARPVATRLAPAFINCVIYAGGAVALFALGAGDRPLAQLRTAGATPVAAVGVMAVLSSVLAGQLFLVGMRTVGVARTVVFIYLVPVLTAVLSASVLDEPFGASEAAGGAAVLAGLWWTTRADAARP